MEKEFEYFAFISYKRDDEKWARWLQRKLESYRLPSIITNEKPELPKRLNPVFRDATDILPGVLSSMLEDNLQKSKYLIVVCSPMSAKSKWVGNEITSFINQGKQNKIILFIVDGEPYSDDSKIECYHPVIKEKLPEMLGVNINEKGKGSRYYKKQQAFIRVVSVLLNVSFDSLWIRQKRRIIRNRILGASIVILFLISIFGVSAYQHHINQPFDIRISLKEKSLYNPNLPFENGFVYMCFNKDTLKSKTINKYNDVIEFKDIPGKYIGKNAKVWFEMFGFQEDTSIMKLSENMILLVERDNTFGKICGSVMDFNGKPIKNAKVVIEREETYTDANGEFNLHFNLKDQTLTKEAEISKSGFKTFSGRYYVGQKWIVALEK